MAARSEDELAGWLAESVAEVESRSARSRAPEPEPAVVRGAAIPAETPAAPARTGLPARPADPQLAAEPARGPAPTPVPPPAARPGPRPRRVPGARAAAELRRGLTAIALCTAMAAAVVCGSLRLSEQLAAVAGAQSGIAALTGADEMLAADLGSIESPARIEQEAVVNLGLERPAAYVPVPVIPTGTLPPPPPGERAEAAVPVLPGPAPGGPVSLWRGARAAVVAMWRRVAA